MQHHNNPTDKKTKISYSDKSPLFHGMYKQAMKTLYDEVIVFDSNRRIRFMNPSAEKNMISSLSKAKFLHLNDLLSKEYHTFFTTVLEAVEAGSVWRGELQFKSKNETPVAVEVTISQVAIENHTLNYFVMVKRNVPDKKIHEMQLKYILEHDALTGLPNRRSFFETLSNEIEEAREKQSMLAVFYINIDKLQTINSLMGHKAGDQLIKAVAKRLVTELPEKYSFARMVSDEYTVIAKNISGLDEVNSIGLSIQKLFDTPFHIMQRSVQITASTGSSVFPLDGDDMETIWKNADDAMYTAKKEGFNLYRPFDAEIYIANVKNALLEIKFKDAVMADCAQFVPYFQPKVDTRTKMLVGSEALVRWITPDEGIISPNLFIPLAESTGLIIPLSRYILIEACKLNKQLNDAGINIAVSVNISPSVMLSSDFIDMVGEAISISGMGSANLDIEITEGMLVEDFDRVNALIDQLHRMGITISIDDFGTGYSSLSYLSKIPVDRLKIDRSFVAGLPTLNDNLALTQTIIMMTKALKIISTAEGVETDSEFDYLRKLDCTEIQGYLISKPKPFNDFLAFAKNWAKKHNYEGGGVY